MTVAVDSAGEGRRRLLLFGAVGLLLSLVFRLIHYDQSLWCDEMSVLTTYAYAPWHKIVMPSAGDYSPNNHFLQTILTKIILQISHTPLHAARVAFLIRFPALIAGALTPLALAWPFWRPAPLLAVLVLVLAALNPFLVEYSDEARGYALMTLLGVIATHLLPDGTKRWPTAYGVVVAAMLYTVPVAGMLVLAHGLTVMMLQKSALVNWLRGVLIGGGLLLLLFLPMARGIWFYSRHPLAVPDSFVDFINQLPRMVWTGEHLPADALSEIIGWFLPVLVLIAGTFFARRQPLLRVPVTVMGLATGLFVVEALFLPSAGQVRFAPWCAIWLVLAIATIGLEIYRWGRRKTMLVVALLFAGWFTFTDIVLLPSQPIREAIDQADAMAPNQADILVGFLGANDSVNIYAERTVHHKVIAAPGPLAFLQAEQNTRQATGHSPWLIISFEEMVRGSTPKFWDYIQANYQLNTRLPGRISPVAIYRPR